MYFRKHWDVLVVDDEPDVRAVTRLALKGMKVYGVPLKIHECGGKTEAMEFFKNLGDRPNIPLALVDVVMETETAGLDLCQYVREELGNRVTQLVVRTGQAGLAPEQDVTDRFDITSYLAKVDATETKLYSVVKSALRLYLYAHTSHSQLTWARKIAEGATERETFLDVVTAMLPDVSADSEGKPLDSVEAHMAFLIGGNVVGAGRYQTVSAATALRDELRPQQAVQMNKMGDTMTRSGNKVLLRLAPDRVHRSTIELVAEINFTPAPEFWVRGYFETMRCMRAHLTHLL